MDKKYLLLKFQTKKAAKVGKKDAANGNNFSVMQRGIMDSEQEKWRECGQVLIAFINSQISKDAIDVLSSNVYDMFPEISRRYIGRYSSGKKVMRVGNILKNLLLTLRKHESYSEEFEDSIQHYKTFLSSANLSEQYMSEERIFAGDIPLQYDYVLAYCVVAFFKKTNAVEHVGQCLFCENLFLAERLDRRKYCKDKCRKAFEYRKRESQLKKNRR